MKVWRGPATGCRLGQMAYHYPFLLITGPACRDWLPKPQAPQTLAGPTLLEGREGPSFSSACVCPASLQPQTVWLSEVPRVLGQVRRSEQAAATCLGNWGCGGGADQADPSDPGPGRGHPGPLDTQLRAEASRKPPWSPGAGNLLVGLCGATLR